MSIHSRLAFIQADNLLNLRNWTKEKKRMYDEVTRQQDHYWASLAYTQEEGMRLGIEQGIERGIGLGIEQTRSCCWKSRRD